MTYKEQYLHPLWQKKRLEILERDNWFCQACFDDEETLHVHHTKYIKGRKVWDYDNDDLITYCNTCHQTVHELMDVEKHYSQ